MRHVGDDPYAIGHRSVSNRGNRNSLWGANVGRGHDPADHGSIMYTNVPAIDAICVIFRPPNMQRGRRGHDRALQLVVPNGTTNYNLALQSKSSDTQWSTDYHRGS